MKDKTKKMDNKKPPKMHKEGLVTCTKCGGDGKLEDKACPKCNGSGVMKGKLFQE